MVDINLFKNGGGEGEEEKEWDSKSPEGNDFEDDLKDGLGFDEDLSTPESFDDSKLLDEEPLPDFDEPDEENPRDGDYEFGDVKEKKSSLWIWILMGIIVVTVMLYVFYIQPKQIAKSTKVVRAIKPPTIPPKTTADKGVASVKQGEAKPVAGTPVGESPVGESTDFPATTYVDASKVIFEDLSAKAQFGAILLNGDQFLVEYVSETPGVADQMGQKIKTLLGIGTYKVSPEDRHRTAGKIYYWGIVSGQLAKAKEAKPVPPGSKKFASAGVFVQSIKDLAGKYNLETIVTTPVDSKVTIKIEGANSNVLQFLQSLKNMSGNYKLEKLFMSSLDYSDFSGNRLKLILDCQIS